MAGLGRIRALVCGLCLVLATGFGAPLAANAPDATPRPEPRPVRSPMLYQAPVEPGLRARPGPGSNVPSSTAQVLLPLDGVPYRRPRPRPADHPAVAAAAGGGSTLAPSAVGRAGAGQGAPLPGLVSQAAAGNLPALLAVPRPQPRPGLPPLDLGAQSVALRLPAGRADGLSSTPSAALCGVPGLKGRKIAPIVSKVRGCGLADGVEIREVGGIPLSMPAEVDCPTARALARWVETGLKPAVGRLGGGVTRIDIAGSYTCRPRNNQAGSKVSEHGRGRAVDVSGIRLANGVSISVERGWRDRQHGKMLRAMHGAACGPFGTVLGPDSDRFHHDHLHFDTASGRAPYCR